MAGPWLEDWRTTGAGGLRLTILDDFSLAYDGEPVPLRTGAQRLLALLAVQRRPMSRPRAAFTLWPDASEPHAFGSLRSALFRLRRCGLPLIADDGRLAVDGGVHVDFRRAVAVTRALEGGRELPESECDPAYLVGELLPDWYEDWVLTERERFAEVRVRGLELLAERYLRAERPDIAADAARAAISADRFRESAYRTLIAASIARGNVTDALLARARLARVWRELGLAPEPALAPEVSDAADRA